MWLFLSLHCRGIRESPLWIGPFYQIALPYVGFGAPRQQDVIWRCFVANIQHQLVSCCVGSKDFIHSHNQIKALGGRSLSFLQTGTKTQAGAERLQASRVTCENVKWEACTTWDWCQLLTKGFTACLWEKPLTRLRWSASGKSVAESFVQLFCLSLFLWYVFIYDFCTWDL